MAKILAKVVSENSVSLVTWALSPHSASEELLSRVCSVRQVFGTNIWSALSYASNSNIVFISSGLEVLGLN